MATDTTSPADVARSVFAAFNAHDVPAMRAQWAEDVEERMPDATVEGADALEGYFRELFAALPDSRMEIVSLAEDGETVFIHWQLTGTHTGDGFQGLRATGKQLRVDGFDRMTIRDGKQVANFVVFDRMGFAQQLGMLPPDGSGPERGMKAAFNAGTSLKARIAKRRA